MTNWSAGRHAHARRCVARFRELGPRSQDDAANLLLLAALYLDDALDEVERLNGGVGCPTADEPCGTEPLVWNGSQPMWPSYLSWRKGTTMGAAEVIRIELGDEVQDTITGFTGVVIAITEWLHGCRRCTVQPRVLHEGKLAESFSFDEPQLVLVTRGVVRGTSDTGGPRPEPLRRETAGRR